MKKIGEQKAPAIVYFDTETGETDGPYPCASLKAVLDFIERKEERGEPVKIKEVRCSKTEEVFTSLEEIRSAVEMICMN